MNKVNQKKDLEALRNKYPEMPDGPAGYGAGTFLFHFLTTPVIEVTGNGKAAKGVWHSPGIMIGAQNRANRRAVGIFFFEKHGVDFIKEDGQWEIWHIQKFYDYTDPLEHCLAEFPVKGRHFPAQPIEPVRTPWGSLPRLKQARCRNPLHDKL